MQTIGVAPRLRRGLVSRWSAGRVYHSTRHYWNRDVYTGRFTPEGRTQYEVCSLFHAARDGPHLQRSPYQTALQTTPVIFHDIQLVNPITANP